jgi:hypothetical protein
VRKSVKVTLTVVGLLLLLGVAVTAGVMLLRPSAVAGPECTVPTAAANASTPTVELTVVQLQHASTINAVGLSRSIPERGRIIAVATAYQESNLRNRPNGDRDSLGLFQQRPSQGWGTAEQIQDPIYASNKFYDALLEVPDWPDMSLTDAAQAVQYSAYPNAYAKWEPQATTLVQALSGGPLELNCAAGARMPTAGSPDRPAPAGTDDATPELTVALAAAQAELGGVTVTGISDDGRTGTVEIALPGLGAGSAGRALAAWAVAHSIGLQVNQVSVQALTWVDHSWESADPIADPAQVLITVG